MRKHFSRVKLNKHYFSLFIICLIIMCYGVYATYKEDFVDIENFGLLTFYNMQSTGFSIVFYLLALFVIPNIFSIQVVIEKQNSYSQFLKTRLGSRQYHVTNLITNTVLTFLFMMGLEILLLLLSISFYSLFLFNKAAFKTSQQVC